MSDECFCTFSVTFDSLLVSLLLRCFWFIPLIPLIHSFRFRCVLLFMRWMWQLLTANVELSFLFCFVHLRHLHNSKNWWQICAALNRNVNRNSSKKKKQKFIFIFRLNEIRKRKQVVKRMICWKQFVRLRTDFAIRLTVNINRNENFRWLNKPPAQNPFILHMTTTASSHKPRVDRTKTTSDNRCYHFVQ